MAVCRTDFNNVRFEPFLVPLVSMLLLSASGCGASTPEISLTDERQSGTLNVALDWPNDFVVDSAGEEVLMPDGLQIIVEAATFESEIAPLVGRQDTDSPQEHVRVDATFELRKESVVIGVVQDPEGGSAERSRTYWVVKFLEIRSADWYRIAKD